MWLVIVAGILVIFYLKINKKYKYWERQGVAHLKPWPLIGSMGPVLFQRRAMAHMMEDLYKAHPEERYTGFYHFFQPIFFIRDRELIKHVLIKDFDSFPEHQTIVPEEVDSIWDRNLTAIKGNRWHDMRATLSPAFTANKMRAMFVLMKGCAKQFSKYFQNKDGIVEVEIKEAFRRYASDVIGSIALGVTCNSLENPQNEVFQMGKTLNDFSGLRGLVFLLYNISPNIMKMFKITIIPEGVSTFFRKLVKETIRIREEKGIVRPDMVHLLLEARKGRLKYNEQNVADAGFAVAEESEMWKTQKRPKVEITDEDITAQAVIFFSAGFETTSTVMSFLCYELALNPNVQDKLTQEIDFALESCNNDITYEALLGIKYLDMVVSETLRKWPSAEATERMCVKNYTIQPTPPEENPVHLTAGVDCWIPIYAIHHDPQYYPNPEKFDPERFASENKSKIKPFTYMPFGLGPRSCIGSRFALLEIKLIVCEILSKFQIIATEKTQVPLVLKKGFSFGLLTEQGFWLGLKPRKVSSL